MRGWRATTFLFFDPAEITVVDPNLNGPEYFDPIESCKRGAPPILSVVESIAISHIYKHTHRNPKTKPRKVYTSAGTNLMDLIDP